tara:strand:- start:46 stop:576 length:531 start_codon:yes stop_codon:yes gene_type:complete
MHVVLPVGKEKAKLSPSKKSLLALKKVLTKNPMDLIPMTKIQRRRLTLHVESSPSTIADTTGHAMHSRSHMPRWKDTVFGSALQTREDLHVLAKNKGIAATYFGSWNSFRILGRLQPETKRPTSLPTNISRILGWTMCVKSFIGSSDKEPIRILRRHNGNSEKHIPRWNPADKQEV